VYKGCPGKRKQAGFGPATLELIFEDCVIPSENLCGKEGDGFIDAMRG
jgi:alkylation response protein AidB-like acyl-CoA dehydrogenase